MTRYLVVTHQNGTGTAAPRSAPATTAHTTTKRRNIRTVPVVSDDGVDLHCTARCKANDGDGAWGGPSAAGLHSKPSTYFAPHRKPLICCICTYLLLLFLARNRFGYLLTYAEIRFFRASDLLTYLSAQRSRRCSGTYLLFPELVFAYPQLVATIYQRTYAAANDL